MNKHLKAALAAAAGLVLATQASATVYHLTYKGTVTSAIDKTAEFGAGATLVGKAFVAHVTYDDAKAGANYSNNGWSEFYSGSGAANPVTVDVMLNGKHRAFGSKGGHDYRYDYSLLPTCSYNCTEAGFEQNASDQYDFINLVGTSYDGAISGIAHTPPNFTNPPVDLFAYISIFQVEEVGHKPLHWADVTAKIDSVSSGVPEPGTWALMLGGFGFTGTMLRRHRSTAAFA